MELFRICRQEYAQQLASPGAANRWNHKGQMLIYTGWCRSLASLELVVHRASIKPLIQYKVIIISVDDEDALYRRVNTGELPANWRSIAAFAQLQAMGAAWYSSQETLILKVPSAVIPQEFNYLINTEHPAYKKKVKLVRTEDFFWDERIG